MVKLVLLRHGESIWNKKNLFTGWTDVDVSEKGVREAEKAAQLLSDNGYTFDIAYNSLLKRATRTLWIVLDKMDLMWLPIINSWRLNERHYGALQGLNKTRTAEKYGDKQVHLWRRSYDIRPPALEKTDPRYPGKDPRYKQMTEQQLPVTESLKDVVERFLPFWHRTVVPELEKKKKILISAHGNSLRALVKYLDNISEDEIPGLNIPTGIPLVYELDEQLKPAKHYYLGDPEEVEMAAQAVADQSKQKKN